MKNGEYELVVASNEYPGKRYREKYAYEHRVVWWKNTGELPNESQVIHHINENKTDNRFENLEVLSRSEHSRFHGEDKTTQYVRMKCPVCGTLFEKERRQTFIVTKPNKEYQTCSKSCGGKASHMKSKKLEENFELVGEFER